MSCAARNLQTALLVGLVFALALRSTWAGSVVVASGDFPAARQPQVAVNSAKAIFVTFGQGESIFCANSTNGGQTFRAPVKVDSLAKLSLGMRRGPRIATTSSGVVISAISHEAGDVRVWVSQEGERWTSREKINDVAGFAREGLHNMASDGAHRLFVTWLDLRNGGAEVWGVLSTDGGESWSKNVRVYRSPDGHVCECCHPSVAFLPDGRIAVMWRNWLGGARDMYVAVSRDGRSFEDAKKLGSGTWALHACPMDGGSLAAGPAGAIAAVWRRENALFFGGADGVETSLGEGRQPVIGAVGKTSYIVWQRAAQLMWSNGPGESHRLVKNGAYPAMAGDIVVWESKEEKGPRILAEVLP